MIRKLRKTERSEAERTHDRAAGWATDRAIEMDLVGVGSRSAHDLARDREMAALECEWLAAQSQLDDPPTLLEAGARLRSEEHTSELQSLMRSSYAGFCLKKKKRN